MEDLKAAMSAVADQPQPESRIDLGRAIREGRALRRRRQAVTSAVAGMAVLAVTGGAVLGAAVLNGPPTLERRPGYGVVGQPGPCQVNQLPSPSDLPADKTALHVTDIDPTGRYVTGTGLVGEGSAQRERPVLWVDEAPSVIPVPGADNAAALAVNRSGVVVGSSDRGPWRYQDGQVTFLPKPDGDGSVAPVAVNDAGDIVGNWNLNDTGQDSSVTHELELRPLLWPAGEPDAVVELKTPGSDPHARATGLRGDGTVVGLARAPSSTMDSQQRILLWRDGESEVLAEPGRREVARASGGWLLDAVDPLTPEGLGTPRVWDLRSGKAYQLSVKVRAMNVNAHGVVAGFVGDPVKPDGTTPVVVRNGGLIELPEPDDRNGWPHAISNGGVVVGNTSVRDRDKGRSMALIWTGC